MAWLFSLSVECGASEAHASELVRALSGRVHAQHTRIFQANDGSFWGVLRPSVDIDDEEAVTRATESVLKALSNYAGAYRFGLAGVEVDEARTWSEVVDDVTEGSSLDCLVLSDESYSALGRPKEFSSFGLAWRKA